MERKDDQGRKAQREKLQYVLMLRQLEEESDAVRAAYQRLSEAASVERTKDIPTVMLDWLESELDQARRQGTESVISSRLLEETVKLAIALRQ